MATDFHALEVRMAALHVDPILSMIIDKPVTSTSLTALLTANQSMDALLATLPDVIVHTDGKDHYMDWKMRSGPSKSVSRRQMKQYASGFGL